MEISTDLKQMYQEIILDLAKEENNKLSIEKFASRTIQNNGNKNLIISKQFNPSCGDKVFAAASFEGSKFSEFFWAGIGCNISMAAANYLGEFIPGKTADEVMDIYNLFYELMNSRGEGLPDEQMDKLGDLSAFQGVAKFPARIKCALLSWEAVKDIIRAKAA
ncbi:MAG: SUF system NifU family Fe-S cluster assembly protein [Bifidobacteriaceae bacterium]|jgi:nitrogen fixation NifU-like protein|nr:SUF system NifU family Fe-S cluster assembly protein [Bifidobacteriaceae bacterium]